MTVFKTFFKIGKKYSANLIMYTIIFLIIAIILGNLESQTSMESYSNTTVNVSVFDKDNSELSKGLTSYLETQHKLVTIENDLDAIRDALYVRKSEYVITIPQGFEASVLAGSQENSLEVYKIPGSVTARFVDMSIDTFLSTYKAYAAGGFTGSEAYEKTLQTIDSQSEVSFYNREVVSQATGIHFFYVYMPYILICVIILSIGPMLIGFNRTQMKDRISCSKVSIFTKNLTLLSASSIYTLAIVLLYFVVSILLNPTEAAVDTALLRLLNVTVQAFVCLAFTFLFSLFTRKAAMLNIFTNILGLSSSFLCGIFVPREFLSDSVAALGRFFPAYWYINVENALCEFSPRVYSTITTGYLVQVLYGVAVLVIALVIGQYQRRR